MVAGPDSAARCRLCGTPLTPWRPCQRPECRAERARRHAEKKGLVKK